MNEPKQMVMMDQYPWRQMTFQYRQDHLDPIYHLVIRHQWYRHLEEHRLLRVLSVADGALPSFLMLRIRLDRGHHDLHLRDHLYLLP